MIFFYPRPLNCLKIADFYYKGVKSRRSDDHLRVKVITPFEALESGNILFLNVSF